MLEKIEKLIAELKHNSGVQVVCCADMERDPRLKEMCRSTASAYGKGSKVPPRYQGRITLCPDGMDNMSNYGGCACLMVHELLHKYGFSNKETSIYNSSDTNRAIEDSNKANENGMIKFARKLLNRKCNGYDTW